MQTYTVEDIQASWDNFKGVWDWDRNGPLHLPILKRLDPVDHSSDLPPTSEMARVVVTKEFGRFGPKPAARYIGTIPGTELRKVLGLLVDSQVVNPAYADDDK